MRRGRRGHGERDSRSNDREETDAPTDLVYGRWPVREALEAGPVAKLLLAQGVGGGPIDEIVSLARQKKVAFHWVDRRQLDQMVGASHQGVVAQVAPFRLRDLDDLWGVVENGPRRGPSLLFLDGVQDPQNLGSLLRSAVFFGVSGVILPRWRAATITAAVVRASAGAARLLPIAQVANLAQAMEVAREKGIWLVGADVQGESARTVDVPRPFALVLGSEGEGLHELIRKRCDLLITIPKPDGLKGVGSLNVGVAGGILLSLFS